MAKINLLPEDLVPKKSIIRLAGVLTKVSYAGIAVFLVFILSVVSIIILNSFRVQNLQKNQSQLLESIKSYEETEMQIVLARDRIVKIKEIWKDNAVKNSLDALNSLLPLFDISTPLVETDITSTKSQTTFSSSGTGSIVKFMSSLMASDVYKTIRLKSFSFNPNLGYRITFEGFVE